MLFSIFAAGFPFLIAIGILIAYVGVLLFSFSMHEFAHAYAADKNGDPTARILGRKSLNPFKHVDPLGLLCLLMLGFGWAKPVPVNPDNYQNSKKSEFWVSIAGIIVNLILGTIFSLIYVAVHTFAPGFFVNPGWFSYFIEYLLYFGMMINFALAMFNLLPIYPLDGSRILELVLKPGNKFSEFMQKYSLFVLLALIIVPVTPSGESLLSFIVGGLSGFIASGLMQLWSLLFSIF